jgi:hypothetical protein
MAEGHATHGLFGKIHVLTRLAVHRCTTSLVMTRASKTMMGSWARTCNLEGDRTTCVPYSSVCCGILYIMSCAYLHTSPARHHTCGIFHSMCK